MIVFSDLSIDVSDVSRVWGGTTSYYSDTAMIDLDDVQITNSPYIKDMEPDTLDNMYRVFVEPFVGIDLYSLYRKTQKISL